MHSKHLNGMSQIANKHLDQIDLYVVLGSDIIQFSIYNKIIIKLFANLYKLINNLIKTVF